MCVITRDYNLYKDRLVYATIIWSVSQRLQTADEVLIRSSLKRFKHDTWLDALSTGLIPSMIYSVYAFIRTIQLLLRGATKPCAAPLRS